jgi:hypothetical protein
MNFFLIWVLIIIEQNIVVNIELHEHPSYVKNIKGKNLSIKGKILSTCLLL